MFPHLNIRNWFTRSHILKEENRTRNRSESCKCKRALRQFEVWDQIYHQKLVAFIDETSCISAYHYATEGHFTFSSKIFCGFLSLFSVTKNVNKPDISTLHLLDVHAGHKFTEIYASKSYQFNLLPEFYIFVTFCTSKTKCKTFF